MTSSSNRAAPTEAPAMTTSAESPTASNRRRLSSKVVVVAPPSDTKLLPASSAAASGTRRASRGSHVSTERLHEASQQALATSGAERYLNLWLFIGVSCGVVAGLVLRNTLSKPLTKRQASSAYTPSHKV
ncbi:hypothetical protein V5799_018179 [Amblyomma americanum]|uniref:Uncharacterized protein n=1 Tax=Amblyomma americanum TaxID=6943 RepID=A0AAQ4F179_AMBAM